MTRRSEIVEAMLGFVLGTISVVFGYWLIALGYNRTVSIPFLTLFGIVLIVIGAIAVIASIAVLRGKKHV
jgi:heme/copper-type cytochrome/quinol oxidase subunit 1